MITHDHAFTQNSFTITRSLRVPWSVTNPGRSLSMDSKTFLADSFEIIWCSHCY